MDSPVTAKFVILSTLLEGPSHGMAIMQRVDRATNAGLGVRNGSVYPALRALTAEGLIEKVEGPSALKANTRIEYRLTGRGRERALAQRAAIASFIGLELASAAE